MQNDTSNPSLKDSPRFVDLFCGIGSFHQSLSALGWQCVMACDTNAAACDTYEANHGLRPLGDVTEIDPASVPAFDVLCAGFPCFTAGTKVLTADSYKNIEDVTMDDTLMTHTGEFHRILNLQRKTYTGDLYTIRPKYHTGFQCTEDHPFYVRTKTSKRNKETQKYDDLFAPPDWKRASELTKNDYFGMKVNENNRMPEFNIEKVVNKNRTDVVNIVLDNPDMWFMMGYFIGDGWIEETKKKDGRCKHTIRFAINNNDKDYVLSRITPILKITDKKCPSGDMCNKYGCCNVVWFNILKMFGKYAHGKVIPEWVQDAPKECVEEFIHGYHTADGCILKNGCHQIVTVSENLALGVQRLYLKLGHIFSIVKCIRPKTTIIEGRTVNQRDTYSVRGYVREIIKKQGSFIEDGYVWYAPFKNDKQHVENEPVYNFEVEHDNSYIIENTVVHNCQPFSQCGLHKGFDDARGTMFFHLMKFVVHHRPDAVILENVRGLLTHDSGATFARMRDELAAADYVLTYKVLTCSDFGLPQMRKRLFMVAARRDAPLAAHIDQVLELDDFKRDSSLSQLLDKNFEKKIAYTIRCGGRRSPIGDKHNWDGYLVDELEYRLTLNDCLKLQGFPSSFTLRGSIGDQWKMLGNTIPTVFTNAVGRNIARLIQEGS